jgi:hypothetical protein
LQCWRHGLRRESHADSQSSSLNIKHWAKCTIQTIQPTTRRERTKRTSYIASRIWMRDSSSWARSRKPSPKCSATIKIVRAVAANVAMGAVVSGVRKRRSHPWRSNVDGHLPSTSTGRAIKEFAMVHLNVDNKTVDASGTQKIPSSRVISRD